MKLEQIYTGCIAHAAYYLESDGEAAIFDPLREVEPYIQKATQNHAKIKYVFETHFHADFVSGHIDLAKKTGADIVYGPTAKPGFKAVVGEDGQVFQIGRCRVKLIHTPGHTLESSTFLVTDESGKDHGIITGDTLFIGDVGRPDLAQHVIADLTQDKLAGMLYHSLREKIMPLSDELIVYPNHGAGSACGKNMSKETTDTLGHQKKVNYALRADMTEEEFKKELLSGLTNPPGFFPKNVLMNIQGYESLDSILERASKGYTVSDFEELMSDPSVLVLDTRDPEIFSKGYISGSLNIGLNGSFAQWVGEMIRKIEQKILLIAEKGKKEEAVIRLSMVGYDYCIGYLEDGINAWCAAGNDVEIVERISASDLMSEYHSDPLIIDVRKRSEFQSEHIINAKNIPLNEIYDRLNEFPKDRSFVIHCAGGYRSMIAASILKSNGFNNFREVRGGMADIKKTALPLTEYVCPTSLL
jgi:hydroxyacylglutathione hydrolase